MTKKENKIVINRRSPKNEPEFIDAYKKANPSANRPDGYDIAAVRAKDGTPGHAKLPPEKNRSKDKNPHRGKDFIPDSELRKIMREK